MSGNQGKMALRLSSAALALGMVSPALAEEFDYDPGDTVYFTYCHAHPPALRINPKDTVRTSTRDASNDAFTTSDTTLMAKLDLSKVNPQTGPFYIEGAEPGDTLVVHIDDISLNRDWGWGMSFPYFGALAPEYKTAMITDPVPDKLFVWRLDADRNVGVLDLPNSRIGHAAQGDGEIDGAAIETSFDVTFTVDLIKGKQIKWPRLETDEVIMTIGSTRPLIDALRIACTDMVNLLVTDYGYDKYEALQLLGQAAKLEIANVVDPQYSVACVLDKKYLPQ
jgi:acetamidase/formamidase